MVFNDALGGLNGSVVRWVQISEGVSYMTLSNVEKTYPRPYGGVER